MPPNSSVETINPNPGKPEGMSDEIFEEMLQIPPELAPLTTLPIYPHIPEIIEMVANNDISVVISEPGSGKTIGLPPIQRQVAAAHIKAEDPGYDPKLHGQPRGIVAEPRRTVTTKVAKDAAILRGVRVGKEVGYQIKGDTKVSEKTDTNVMTVGVFLAIWDNDHLLTGYEWFILDEAHEESVDMAMALGFVQITNEERAKAGMPPLRVVVTSATIDREKYGEKLSRKKEKTWFGLSERTIPVASIEVPGNPPTVKYSYLERELTEKEKGDYVERSAQRVTNWMLSNREGDSLAFVPGVADIRSEIKRIKELLPDPNQFEIYAFYGAADPGEVEKIFAKKTPTSKRKIIVATNAAETSFTHPPLVYVDDTTLIKETRYNRATGIQKLEAVPHSQSGLIQRARRSGRIPGSVGQCFRDCTRREYENRPKFSIPELLRTHLGPTILKLKSHGIRDVKRFKWVDPPPVEYFDEDIKDCQLLGALDANENITPIGEKMLKFNMKDMEYSRMMVQAEADGSVDDVLTLIAFMEQNQLYGYHRYEKTKDPEKQKEQREKQNEIYRAQAALTTNQSDPVSFLRTFKAFEYNNYTEYNRLIAESPTNPTPAQIAEIERKWAEEHHVNLETLHQVRKEKQRLAKDMPIPVANTPAYNRATQEEREDMIGKAFTAGYIKNLMVQASGDQMRRIFFKKGRESGYDLVKKHGSTRTKGMPGIRAGHYLVGTLDSAPDRDNPDKIEIFTRIAQIVKPEWIIEVAPHLVQKQRGLDYDYAREVYFETIELVLKGTKEVLRSTPVQKRLPNGELTRQYLSKKETEQEKKRRREAGII